MFDIAMLLIDHCFFFDWHEDCEVLCNGRLNQVCIGIIVHDVIRIFSLLKRGL